jgi:streptogramin lyase
LPSTVPTSGVTFKLETFNLTTGELLDVETGSVVLTGSKASAVGAGAIVSFPGTKSPFNPKYADTYIWELVSESTEIGGTFKEYSLAAGSVPTQIVEGPDGNMWFTEQGANKIGRMTPTGGLTEYSVAGADPGGLPWGIVVGPDNNLWFTEFCFTGNTCGEIGRISTTGTMKLFPAAPGTPALNDPLGITLGPDRNLWFTDAGTGNIGYSTVSGAIKQFSVVTPKLDALKFITAGPDGNLWFTEEAYDKIGRITTSGIAKEYSVPTANAMPNGIVASGNLFFAEYAAGKIGDSTPAGSITEYTVPVKSNPQYLIVGPDSNIWFTDGLTNALGRLDLTTKLIEETAPVPTAAANPLGIASGPGGTIWFTEFNANKIGVFTPL